MSSANNLSSPAVLRYSIRDAATGATREVAGASAREPLGPEIEEFFWSNGHNHRMPENLQFWFCGKFVGQHMTPADLGMEDGDVIVCATHWVGV